MNDSNPNYRNCFENVIVQALRSETQRDEGPVSQTGLGLSQD